MQVNPCFRNLEGVKVGDRRWTWVGRNPYSKCCDVLPNRCFRTEALFFSFQEVLSLNPSWVSVTSGKELLPWGLVSLFGVNEQGVQIAFSLLQLRTTLKGHLSSRSTLDQLRPLLELNCSSISLLAQFSLFFRKHSAVYFLQVSISESVSHEL